MPRCWAASVRLPPQISSTRRMWASSTSSSVGIVGAGVAGGGRGGGRRRQRRRQQLGRQVVRPQLAVVVQERRAGDHRAQLSDVAGPAVALEEAGRLGRDPLEAAAELARRLGQEVLAERAHVGDPLAQRRQMHGDGVDPVEQIFAEAVRRDGGRQVAVGGGDDARVDPSDRGGPHAPERPLFEEGEQLGLRGGAEIANLVEEQRPAVGDLHEAELALARVREGAALVAEQLALHQVLGDGGAVELDEGAGRARRAVVQHARHRLLAGAALAGHQHQRHGAPGDHLHLVEEARHLRRRVHEGAPPLRRRSCAAR